MSYEFIENLILKLWILKKFHSGHNRLLLVFLMFQLPFLFIKWSKYDVFRFIFNINEKYGIDFFSGFRNKIIRTSKWLKQSEIKIFSILRCDDFFPSKTLLELQYDPKNLAENTFNRERQWRKKKSLFDRCIAIAKSFQDDARSGYFQFVWRLHWFFFAFFELDIIFFFFPFILWFILRIFNHKIK